MSRPFGSRHRLLQGGRVDLGEGVVDRREDGDVLGRVQRVDQAGRLDRGDQGREQRVVARGGGDRVGGHAVERAGAVLRHGGAAGAERPSGVHRGRGGHRCRTGCGVCGRPTLRGVRPRPSVGVPELPQAARPSGRARARAAIGSCERGALHGVTPCGCAVHLSQVVRGRSWLADCVVRPTFFAGSAVDAFRRRSTTTSWMPLEPLGNGVAPLGDLRVSPLRSVARTADAGGGRAWRPRGGTTGASSRCRRPGRAGLLPRAVVDADLDLARCRGAGPRRRRRSRSRPALIVDSGRGGVDPGWVLIGASVAQPRSVQ